MEREIKIVALRKALNEGEESGTAEYSLNGQIKELDNEGSEQVNASEKKVTKEGQRVIIWYA